MYIIYRLTPFTSIDSKKLYELLQKVNAVYANIDVHNAFSIFHSNNDDSISFIASIIHEKDIIKFAHKYKLIMTKE